MKKGRFLTFSLAVAITASILSTAPVSAVSLLGDLNSDGNVDSIDFAYMRSNLLGMPITIDTSASDLDGNGSTNSIDFAVFRNYLLGKITAFPAQTSASTPVPTSTPTKTKNEVNLTGDIIFSVPSGTFKNQISVSLSSNISNAQIRYTTDGSVPTNSSALYSSALSLTKTTEIRAQAFANGAASGAMGTALYIASAIDTQHDIPVIIIDDYGKGKPGKTDYTECAVMVQEPQDNTQTSILQTPTLVTRAGIHIRGQSSANFEKAPYRLEFWDNENKDAKFKLLGLGKDGDWALLSPYPDKSLIRNALAYTLGEKMDLQAPGFRHVEVYLNTDNQPLSADDYQGVYLLVETPEIAKNRLDIAKLEATDLSEPNISGGYLMQFNMGCAEEPLIKGSGWKDLELTEPSDAQPAQLTWITDYIQKTHNAIHSSNPSDPTTGYPAYIDVDSFVNFIITNEIAREGDSYMRSTRIYKDRSKKLMAGPLWDYDLGYDSFTGMGGFGGSSSTEGWQFQSMMGSTCDWYNTLMKDPSFQSKISARWKELRQGPLSDGNLSQTVKDLSSPLSNAAKRNFQKWNILSTGTVGGFGTQKTQTWEEQLTILENFLLKRCAWLDNSGWKPTTGGGGGWPGWGGL